MKHVLGNTWKLSTYNSQQECTEEYFSSKPRPQLSVFKNNIVSMKITESSLFTIPEIFKIAGMGANRRRLLFYFQEGKAIFLKRDYKGHFQVGGVFLIFFFSITFLK